MRIEGSCQTMWTRIRRAARDIAQRAPFIFNPLWKAYYPLARPDKYFPSYPEAKRDEVFREIYKANGWKSEQSKSGPGSTMLATANLRRKLPELLRRLGVETFLDAPCGDFNWMRTVDLQGIKYIGGDIVPEIINDLQAKYSGPGRQFLELDIVQDKIPRADLWLCRDVLFHLSEADVLRVLKSAASADIRYFLTSSHPFEKQNRDIYAGGFRHINLRKAPYNLPEPLEAIEDFVVPYAPRVLWLWSREQLQLAMNEREGRALSD